MEHVCVACSEGDHDHCAVGWDLMDTPSGVVRFYRCACEPCALEELAEGYPDPASEMDD